MDYAGIYGRLMERARGRNSSGYFENHHVAPRCLGGTDEPSNMVRLTPEEHYVAHQLLVKLYPDNLKLAYAATMMGNTRKGNKVYGWLKRRASDLAKGVCTIGAERAREVGRKVGLSNKGKPKPKEWRAKMSVLTRGNTYLRDGIRNRKIALSYQVQF